MATFDRISDSPGKGAVTPLLVNSNRVLRAIPLIVGFDTSYPTGGELLPTDITDDLKTIKGGLFESKSGFVFRLDVTGKKIMAFRFDYPAAAAGPAIEVPNLTDLSAVTGVFGVVFGY